MSNTAKNRRDKIHLSKLGFAGFKRHPRGTRRIGAYATKKPHRVTPRRGFGILERETGLEPATLSFGNRTKGEK